MTSARKWLTIDPNYERSEREINSPRANSGLLGFKTVISSGRMACVVAIPLLASGSPRMHSQATGEDTSNSRGVRGVGS